MKFINLKLSDSLHKVEFEQRLRMRHQNASFVRRAFACALSVTRRVCLSGFPIPRIPPERANLELARFCNHRSDCSISGNCDSPKMTPKAPMSCCHRPLDHLSQHRILLTCPRNVSWVETGDMQLAACLFAHPVIRPSVSCLRAACLVGFMDAVLRASSLARAATSRSICSYRPAKSSRMGRWNTASHARALRNPGSRANLSYREALAPLSAPNRYATSS